jgi:spore germination cell wall hydrolase CwlJ-like protein
MKNSLLRLLLVPVVLLAGCGHAPPVEAHTMKEQQHCLALALYWEARGEGSAGMTAVGWTIMNRVYHREFPATPCEVVYQGGEQRGCQFSWWCDGKSDKPRDWHSWEHALLISAKLLTDPPADPTRGALFYHSTSIAVPWRRKRLRTAQIGRHIFYR